MGWDLASIAGRVAGETVKGIATPGFDAWARTKESAAATHKVDAETNRDITVSSFQADTRQAELQTVLAQGDRGDKRTSWIRPAGAAISLYVFACVAIEHSMPRLAKLLWIETSEMPLPWGYLCAGILGAIFGLRPLEKWWRGKQVIEAHATIAQAQVAAVRSKITTRRADD